MDEVLSAAPGEGADAFETEALLDEAVVLLDRPTSEIGLEDVDHLLRGIGRLGREQDHGLRVLGGAGDDEPEGPAVLLEAVELDAEGAEGAVVGVALAGGDTDDVDLGHVADGLEESTDEDLAAVPDQVARALASLEPHHKGVCEAQELAQHATAIGGTIGREGASAIGPLMEVFDGLVHLVGCAEEVLLVGGI